MKKNIFKTLLVSALVSFGLTSSALTPPPNGGGHTPGHQNAPLDGGASLLIGAGIVYGIKKAYNGRKKVND